MLKHRRFDGFLVTMQHSGTHWLKYMMSAAIAHHLGLPPPAYIHNASSNEFIGHPKQPRRYSHAPRIASSHSIPHLWLDSGIFRKFFKLPRYALLVRDMRAALVSNFEKWKSRYGVGFGEYLRGDPAGQRYVMDIWWCMHFLNRWGRVARRYPEQVMVVRYEDLGADAVGEITRIFDHFALAIPCRHIQRAVADSTKEKMVQRLDPNQAERNIVRSDEAPASAWFDTEDRSYFDATLAHHLDDDFGYDYRW